MPGYIDTMLAAGLVVWRGLTFPQQQAVLTVVATVAIMGPTLTYVLWDLTRNSLKRGD
jgi:hypothetical protein